MEAVLLVLVLLALVLPNYEAVRTILRRRKQSADVQRAGRRMWATPPACHFDTDTAYGEQS